MRWRLWQRVVATAVGIWIAVGVPGFVAPNQALWMGAQMAGAAGDQTVATAMQCAHGRTGTPLPPRGSGQHSRVPARTHRCECDCLCCTPATVGVPVGRLVAVPVVQAPLVKAPTPRLAQRLPESTPQVTLPPPLGPPTVAT